MVPGMIICNKGCEFNTSHTTGLHDTRAAYVQNNQPFTLPATHVFQNKMASASSTVPQVSSNNEVGTQAPPPINGGTYPVPTDSLHHMGASVIAYHCTVQKRSVFENHKNSVYNPELSSFISDL